MISCKHVKRVWHLVAKRWPRVVLPLLCTIALAAEVHDPFVQIGRVPALAVLREIRPLLAKSPQDQALLGTAIRAMVVLCVEPAMENCGGIGPWYQQLQALAVRWRKAAGPSPADPLPGLWADWIAGKGAAVLAKLPENVTGESRALRILAGFDLRGWPSASASNIEQFAGAVAHVQLGLGGQLGPISKVLSSQLQACGIQIGEGYARSDEWNAVLFAALADPLVDDEQARKALLSIAQVRGLSVPPNADRRAMAGLLLKRTAGARSLSESYATIAGFHASLAGLAVLDAGVRGGADPAPERLAGPGDVASWLMQRGAQLELGWSSPLAPDEPEIMPGWRRLHDGDSQTARAELMSLMKRSEYPCPGIFELIDNYRVIVSADGTYTSKPRSNDFKAEVRKIVLNDMERGLRPPRGVSRLRTYDPLGEQDKDQAVEQLRRRLGDDPCDLRALKILDQMEGSSFRSIPGGPPVAEWVDAAIDREATPELGAAEAVAITWRGLIHLPGGRISLTLACAGYARLVIDGESLVAYSHKGAEATRAWDRAEGWYRFDLRAVRTDTRKGAMRCKLSWGTGGPTLPIPPAAFAHGQPPQAGLLAQGWSTTITQAMRWGFWPLAGERTVAQARAYPWHLRTVPAAAYVLLDRGEAKEANRLLQTLPARQLSDDGRLAALVAALSADAPREVQLTAMETWGGLMPVQRTEDFEFSLQGMRGLLFHQLEHQIHRLDLQQELLSVLPTRPNDTLAALWLRMSMTLGRGDLAEARKQLMNLGEVMRSDTKLAGRGWVPDLEAYGIACLHWWLLERAFKNLDAPPPQFSAWWTAAEARAELSTIKDYATGVIDLASAQATLNGVPAAAALDYYHGLVLLTTGSPGKAQAVLTAFAKDHAGLAEAPVAGALARWLAKQTPQTLAGLPAGKPLASGSASDF